MTVLSKTDYLHFKELIEYFVTHLEYMARGEKSKNLLGYAKYLKPLVDSGKFAKEGMGYKGAHIRIEKQILAFNKFPHNDIHIRVGKARNETVPYTSKFCYLTYDWLNIRATKAEGAWDLQKKEIKFLKVVMLNESDDDVIESKDFQISDLGLFDGNVPNKKISEMADYYFELFDKYYGGAEEKMMKEKLIEYTELLKKNKNLILHGAPGTGKTYMAKEIVSYMIFDKPKSELSVDELKVLEDHTGFIQFHPSFDYSDFIEGLRPIKDPSSNQIGFERKDGVFKEFCKKALGEQIDEGAFESAWEKFTSLINDNTRDNPKILKTNPKKNEFCVALNQSGSLDLLTGSDKKYNGTLTKEKIKIQLSRGNKYWQGYYQGVIDFLKSECNLKIPKKTVDERPFVFIIDEINRGEINKIFGELFFTIDSGYRGLDSAGNPKGLVKTQYQNLLKDSGDIFENGFFIPKNVFIIGTMNDIDRSVESMDFAMRRRFAFENVEAKISQGMFYNKEAWLTEDGKVVPPNDEELDELIKRMNRLNDAISSDEPINDEYELGLDVSYEIGAAYFLKLKEYGFNEDGYEKLWKNHLKGILTEYLRGQDSWKNKLDILYNMLMGSETSEEDDNDEEESEQ